LQSLREENARLRSLVAEHLDTMADDQRSTFLQQHSCIRSEALSLGEDIPVLEYVGEEAVLAEEPSNTIQAHAVVEEKGAQSSDSTIKHLEDGVVMQQLDEDTLIFKFSDQPASSAVKNMTSPKAMSVGEPTDQSSQGRRRRSSSSPTNNRVVSSRADTTSGAAKADDNTIVFRFNEVEEEAAEDKQPVEEKKTVEPTSSSVASTISSSGSTTATTKSVEDKDNVEATSSSTLKPKAKTNKTRRTTTMSKPPALADLPPVSSSSVSSTASIPASTTPKKTKDPFAAARSSAQAEATSHSPAEVIAGKEGWLYFSVPEKPVAGADCVVFFNKAQSEILRHSSQLQLHPKYNAWELDSPLGDRITMQPAADTPRSDGTDFWSVKFEIPNDAFELNFVVSDSNNNYDNNSGINFVIPVTGPMTQDSWIDAAAERAEAAYLALKETERNEQERLAAEREAAAQQQDADLAKQAVQQLKDNYQGWQQGAVTDASPFWNIHIVGGGAVGKSSSSSSVVSPGSTIKLLYNKAAGCLAGIPIPDDQHLVLKIGFNSWQSPQDVVMKRSSSAKDGEWWEASYTVPQDACVLNFVFNYYEHYDNNNSNDHKIPVSLPAGVSSPSAWAESMEGKILARIRAERKAREDKQAKKEARRLAVRQAAQKKTEEVRRKQMRHVLFTTPGDVKAGSDVTIHYNPSNTNLNGSERIYLTGGYNRWRHKKNFTSIEMKAPSDEGQQHFTSSIQVPKDAYSVEFVFSNSAEGGVYDNNNGLDYHLPVTGSVVSEPPLNICHIAVEMAPIAKVGGLGDVVTALGRAVQESGHNVEVILPRYDFFAQSPLLGDMQFETEFEWAGTRIWVSKCVVEGLRVFFIEAGNGMFNGPVYHGGQVDAGRFEFFSRAALEFLVRTGRQHDIIHCHDWSTADVAKAYWDEYHHYGLWKPKIIFTIHNLNYGEKKIGEAAFYSQRFTTVSPTYAWEIGGNAAIAPNNGKLKGIRNGIDIDIWDPETDVFLPMGYTSETVVEGKAAAREELRRRLNLTGWGDKPLVGVVTRLTKQKGTHLIAHSAWRTLDRGGQFVLLGSAPDPKVQAEFDGLASRLGGDNAAFCFAFDEPLSHLIYAACDYILVPSMFEPCGLTQMIAMRYGSVPVVRKTGGLADTVFDLDSDKARAAWEMEGEVWEEGSGVEDATNGFNFEGTDEGALDWALNRALDTFYNDKEWVRGLQKRVMEQDWSWNKPGADYIQLYYAAMK